MHRWLGGQQPGAAGHYPYHPDATGPAVTSNKSNSYHGEPYIPADVFNVSISHIITVPVRTHITTVTVSYHM